jgi:hypothetical protein
LLRILRLSTTSKDKVVVNNYALNKAYISVFNGELKGKVKRYILDKPDVILKHLITLCLPPF